jgi:hypothetical protein
VESRLIEDSSGSAGCVGTGAGLADRNRGRKICADEVWQIAKQTTTAAIMDPLRIALSSHWAIVHHRNDDHKVALWKTQPTLPTLPILPSVKEDA